MSELQNQFDLQTFTNDYQLVNGVVMHRENPENFHVPPEVIKRHIQPGQYVELRIDSPRFSVHEEDAGECSCPSCHGEMTKPILRHEHPASLMRVPEQSTPSRGWGEDFWVRVTGRSGTYLGGMVDNPLVESRLHGLVEGGAVYFQEDHILAVHDIHRGDLVAGMDVADLKELAEWVGQMRRDSDDG